MAAFKIFEVAVAMVFALGAMEAAMTGAKFKKKFEPTDEEMAREIGQFLATIQSLFDPKKNMTDFPGVNGYCKCEDNHCRCCQHILWKELCVVLEHHHHSNMFELSLRYGHWKLISHTFSVKNHPPFCFHTHFILGTSVCLRLNHLRIHRGKLHACIAISTKYLWFIKKTYNLGCFNIVNNEKMELKTVMKLTHEMAKHFEQPAIWIKAGEPIAAFPDVVSLFMAAGNVDQPLQEPDEK